LKQAVLGSDLIVVAVPSQHMRSVLKKLSSASLKPGVSFLSVSKGIENTTLMRMSEVIEDTLGNVDMAVLSGPTISHEVSRGMPTTVVVASGDERLASQIQGIFNTASFRVYTSNDVVGVELGGSLKNVIAIAGGVLDGLNLGANTKAGLVARGLVEISRLGSAMGAKRETFYGVSGLGDLVTTCISTYGRNRWFGEEIGKGKKPNEILKKTEMVVEGFATAKSAYELAKKYRVDMPITEEIYKVLYKNKPPKKAIADLMSRPLKAE
jgi:glycerol-3-phosphate dehydrogenase (NAD(P)+)